MATTGTEAPERREARAAAAGAPIKRAYVQRMFSEIAPRYDLLNRLLSLGIDRSWRRAALGRMGWERTPRGMYLDLCAGTLDVGAALAHTRGFAGTILGADFAEPMLRAGRGKAPPDTLWPVAADALALPLADASCAGAIVAFGIRNVEDLDASLVELHRVLAPGGRLVILELSTPPQGVLRSLYLFYFHHILPRLGGAISGHPSAYGYLPASVKSFPEGGALAERMRAAGFTRVSWNPLTLGIAAIHSGER